jgi:hypothetical protein
MASSSKWGSYFQQTLAGVESRLDTILVGDEVPRPNQTTTKPTVASTVDGKPESGGMTRPYLEEWAYTDMVSFRITAELITLECKQRSTSGASCSGYCSQKVRRSKN